MAAMHGPMSSSICVPYCEGTQIGDWLSMPASGRQMRTNEVHFFRIEDGRTARLWGLEHPDPRATAQRDAHLDVSRSSGFGRKADLYTAKLSGRV